jgi:enterochelin esterase-like enzyme
MDDSHWDELGIDELADEGINQGWWEPFIIVMPFVPDHLYVQTDGGPGSYEEEFVSGLVPFMDRVYRTQPVPEGRALAGVSRGGVWALEIAFRNPDLLSTLAALSPALHVNRARPQYDPYSLVKEVDWPRGAVFLSAGDQERDFRQATEKMGEELAAAGVRYTYVLASGGHQDATWAPLLMDLLRFTTARWDP